MKINYTAVIISAVISAVAATAALKLIGNPMGLPESWNPAVVGAFTAVISSICGQKFARASQ